MHVKSLCESSFYEFIKHAWVYVEGRNYIDGWHVQAMAEHLQAVHRLEIRDLLINLPPRMGKSLVISALFPAWCWTVEPGLRFLYTSYSQVLSIRDSVHCRRLIGSEWYQRLWGHTFSISRDVNNKLRFDNDKHGYRIASSIGGTITGQGGDIVCCDDPNDINTIHSPVVRDGTNDWFDFVVPTRFCLAEIARRIVSQQRGHLNDLTGHILSLNDPDWVFLCLPMEFEVARRSTTIPLPMSKGKVWTDPRKHEGELLWPQGMNGKSVEKIKRTFHYDSYTIASQLQQRPSPAEGGLLKKEWFRPWEEEDYPPFQYILQSWDTALTGNEKSCHSACTTWGIFKHPEDASVNLMLLSVFREQIEGPELRRAALRLAHNYEDTNYDEPIAGHNPPHLILIEQKVNGYTLLQQLLRLGLPVMKFNPGKYGCKLARCRLVSYLAENGLVWLPTELPHCKHYTRESQIFLEAAVNFPSDKSETGGNDIIDSMSQAWIKLTQSGWISGTQDPKFDTEPSYRTIKNRKYS